MTVQKRYDFLLFFEVINGNPNGDPDADNEPRKDPDTNIGIITDVCLKSKIKKYVAAVKEGVPGYDILVRSEHVLNTQYEEAYAKNNLAINPKGLDKKSVQIAKEYMCENFYDVRTFGGVMSTGDYSCGKVTGPIQIGFSNSLDPISTMYIALTRQARTTEKRSETGDTEFGHKYIIPYALYAVKGHFSPARAKKTGMTDEDLNLFWNALVNMFEDDHSAARGEMNVKKLFIFEHEQPFDISSLNGETRADKLFEKIKAYKVTEIPTSFHDYRIEVDRNMPKGVTLIEI